MDKLRYMISDAATLVNVEAHVLRYWEEELELNIPRNEMGHRYYTKENIQQFLKIKELKEKGYQLKAIKLVVHNQNMNPEEAAYLLSQNTQQVTPPIGLQQTTSMGMSSAGVQQPQISGMEYAQPNSMQTGDLSQTQAAGLVQMAQSAGIAPTQQPQIAEPIPQVRSAEDKMAQFRVLMNDIVKDALKENNQALGKSVGENVGERVLKEMNYLMREQDEQEEERFRKLDAAIREIHTKKPRSVRKKKKKRAGFWQKKKRRRKTTKKAA